MNPMRRCPLVSIFLAGAMLAATPSIAEPAFFSEKPYDEAMAQAVESEKLFFVKATADWCGPCKMMDRTTFKDQRVIDWLTGKAVSVSVDVDDERALAGKLSIRAMPTTILFRGDEELARVVGYRDADQLLTWLGQAESGEIVPVAKKPRPPAQDAQGRLDRADALLRDGEYAQATEEYLWLWDNMLEHNKALSGVRVSFMAGNMNKLSKSNAEARAAFEKLRDDTEDRLLDGDEKTWDDLRDWLVLNERVLGDREPIRKWIDRIKDRPTANLTFGRTRDIIGDILIDDGRWALYGELIDDPFRDIRMHEMLQQMDQQRLADQDEEMKKVIQNANARNFRNGVSETVAALLAAGREDEARQVADRAVALEDNIRTRAAIVDTSLKAGQARAWHLELLTTDDEAASRKLAPMRKKVEAKLRG